MVDTYKDTDLTSEEKAIIENSLSLTEEPEIPDSQTDSLSEEEKFVIENALSRDAEVEETGTGSEVVEEPLPVSRASRDLPLKLLHLNAVV